MKKKLTMLSVLYLICVITAGCAYVMVNQTPAPASSVSAGSDNAALSPEGSAAGQKTSAQALSADTRSADVDLTALSSTMIFAEVYNIMVHPDDYVGRTVKMSGPYYAGYYEETEQYYHYVIIADALACCQQGLEFVLNGERSGDYPADNTRIEVVGVFDSYEELGETYYHVVVDDIVVL